jgi:peptidoglycan DL-endopeptidase CwlO
VSGRVLRSACTAALATLTVLTAVPSASYAAAEPGDGTAVGASAATAVPVPASPPPSAAVPTAAPEPGPGAADAGALAGADVGSGSPPGTLSAMLGRLQRLYRQTEEATEVYNATEVELTRMRAEASTLDTGLTRARTALERSRSEVGRLARAQYQGQSDLSDYLRLLLSPDPGRAIDGGHLLERAARSRVATIARLQGDEKYAATLATASRKALDQQQALATKQKKQRDVVRTGLQEVEKLLASLSGEEIAALASLEKSGTDKAQREFLASGALGEATSGAPGVAGAQGPAGASASLRTPSAQGEQALAFAAAQIGKPYEWGAEGPGSFDCSGLTSRAWARAGLTIPRTSQEQWRTLPRVPIPELRPGDLVVYFPKATHVAIYAGDGMVIQAPRPGGHVKVSPIAANPLLGAVRPDPDAVPLTTYHPPILPTSAMQGSGVTAGSNATDGSDHGYADGSAPADSTG